MNLGYYRKENTDKEAVQALPDVQWALEEILSIKEVLLQYNKDERDYYHLHAPSMASIQKVLDHILLRVEHNRDTNFCLIFVAIGHAIKKDGVMHYALNELDEKTNYFKLFNLEEANKALAEN